MNSATSGMIEMKSPEGIGYLILLRRQLCRRTFSSSVPKVYAAIRLPSRKLLTDGSISENGRPCRSSVSCVIPVKLLK